LLANSCLSFNTSIIVAFVLNFPSTGLPLLCFFKSPVGCWGSLEFLDS
jgi:hypothetical protein